MSVPFDALMERVSLAIEKEAGLLTKTAVSKVVRPGSKPDVLRAINYLLAESYIESTPGGRAPVLTSLKPYRTNPEPVSADGEADGAETTQEPAEKPPKSTEKPPVEPVSIIDGKPLTNRGGQRRSLNGGGPKDRAVPSTSNITLVREPRCRVCRHGDARQTVNRMLAEGYSLAACLQGVAPINATLPFKSRITIDSLRTHRTRHFDLEAGAAGVWRTMMEERAAAEAVNYEQGVTSLVTSRLLLEAVRDRGFATVLDSQTQITVDQAIAASRELEKLAANEDVQAKWAKQQAQMNLIVEAFRTLPEPFQQQVLAVAEGRTPVAPTGGLAVIEGRLITDTGSADPFGDDNEDYDDEDDD